MELELDPRAAIIAGIGAALVGSPEARRTVGRGLGWVAGTTWRVARPVVQPLYSAGREMAGDVRTSASEQTGAGAGDAAAPAERAGRTRRASPATG